MKSAVNDVTFLVLITFITGGTGSIVLEKNVTDCIKYFIDNFLYSSKLLFIHSLNDGIEDIHFGRKLTASNMFQTNIFTNNQIDLIKGISEHSSLWIVNTKISGRFYLKTSCLSETVIVLSENYNSFSDTLTKFFDYPCSNTSVLMFVVVLSKVEPVVEVLWRTSVTNCVVLDAYNFNIYTWFPLRKSERVRCTDRPEPELIGRWSPRNRTLTNRTSIFLQNKINKMNNCTVNVNIHEWPPYAMASGFNATLNKQSAIDETKLDGVDIRIFNIFKEKLGFHANYTMKSLNTMHQTLAPSLTNRLTDVGFSGIPFMWAKKEHGIGMTSVYVTEDSTWYVPKVQPYKIGENIVRVLSIQFWILIFVSYIVMVLVLKATSKGVERFHSLLLLATILGMSSQYKPTRVISRVTYIIFTYSCFEIYISYQTSLMSHLVSPHYEPAINTFDDILTSKLRIVTNNVTRVFLGNFMSSKTHNLFREKVEVVENFEDMLQKLVTTKNYATVCTETCIKKYFPQNVSFTENIRRIDETYWKVNMVMVTRKGSPLLNLLNRHLELCFQSGILMKIWIDISKSIEAAATNVRKSVVPLNVDQLKDVFIGFCIGLSISCLLFLSEVLFHNYFHLLLLKVK